MKKEVISHKNGAPAIVIDHDLLGSNESKTWS
jgi:hypothetical protein